MVMREGFFLFFFFFKVSFLKSIIFFFCSIFFYFIFCFPKKKVVLKCFFAHIFLLRLFVSRYSLVGAISVIQHTAIFIFYCSTPQNENCWKRFFCFLFIGFSVCNQQNWWTRLHYCIACAGIVNCFVKKK